MSFKNSIFSGAVMAASISLASAFAVHARDVPEISPNLYERYGSDRDSANTSRNSGRSERCSTLENLSQGRILQNEFARGQGRTSLSISRSDGGTVEFKIELGTRGMRLPSESCGPISNIF